MIIYIDALAGRAPRSGAAAFCRPCARISVPRAIASGASMIPWNS